MIRYELKDKERQAALEKALPGFKEILQRACENHELEYFDEHKSVAARHCTTDAAWGSGEWLIALPTDDIEVIEEYDPNKWNNYPEVTPPEGVWMRVETWDACGGVVRGVFIHVNGTWRRSRYTAPNDEIKVARFRPWDEEAAK